MKISVVIPVFNEEAYIASCLDSLLAQEESPDEIIVIDNNSTDKTVRIVKKYPVRLLHEKKQGIIPARNKGYSNARFDIIARTDADTILPHDWIKEIKKTFTKDKKLMALSGTSKFYDIPVRLSDKTIRKAHMSYLLIVKKILGHDCMYGPNMALRKEVWKKIKNKICLNDNEVHEDIDMAIHIAEVGKIKLNRSLTVDTSFRRFSGWKNIDSYFEYTYRTVKSIQKHNNLGKKLKNKILTSRTLSHPPSVDKAR